MKMRVLWMVGILSMLVGITPSTAADTIILNTGIREPFTDNKNTGFIDQIVAEVFNRIGIQADVIVYQNSSKALKNANSGVDDGAALRIKGLEKKFPNLIRVPEKLMDNDFVAYSMGETLTTEDWSALDGSTISYIKGWQIFQNNLKGHKSTTLVKKPQHMFDLLTRTDVDFLLYERWQGLWRAHQLGITLTAHEPPLAQREMFIYLNKKHENMVEEASVALSAMKKDGTYQKIFDATLGQL